MQWDEFGKKSSIENFFDAILFGGQLWQSTGSHLICHVCFSYYGFRRFPGAQEGQMKVQKGPSYAVWQSYLVPTLLNICTTWFTTDLLYNLIYFEVLMNAVPSGAFEKGRVEGPRGSMIKQPMTKLMSNNWQLDIDDLLLSLGKITRKVVCRHPFLQLA